MLQIRSNTSTVPVSQMHVVYSIWMTIADVCFVRTHPANCFVIIPVLIRWLVLQLGVTLACFLHSKEFEFVKLHNALSTLLSTLLHIATVGLRHSGHVIPIFAYMLGKIIAMTRNKYNQSLHSS